MMPSLPFTFQEEIFFSKPHKMTNGSITLNWNNFYKYILQNSKGVCSYFLKNRHWTFDRVTKTLFVLVSQGKITYYEAESLSWYSLDLLKQACTPPSRHNRLITPANSGVMTPSSALPAKTNNCRASSWGKHLRERDDSLFLEDLTSVSLTHTCKWYHIQYMVTTSKKRHERDLSWQCSLREFTMKPVSSLLTALQSEVHSHSSHH